MYVILGIGHPFHENSRSWVVDCFLNDDVVANEILQKLNEITSSSIEDKEEKLKNVHRRAIDYIDYDEEIKYYLFNLNDNLKTTYQ